MLQKDDAEHPVPEPLRSTFRQMAGAFVAGDFQLCHHPIEALAPLNEEDWENPSQFSVAAW